MIHFISPLGLLAAFAVIVPITIHLLSRTPASIVKVGSLQFLTSSKSARFKSLRPSEFFLLFVRMAIIVLLAFLLAQPVWLKQTSAHETSGQGWILVAPQLLTSPAHGDISFRLDSLAGAGHELHELAAGFPAVRPGDSLKGAHAKNYWSLMREADHTLPEQMPVWIFATDLLSAFQGERPKLRREFHWQISGIPRVPPPATGNNSEVQSSVPKDTIHVMVAHSLQTKDQADYVKSALFAAAEANDQHLHFADQFTEIDQQPGRELDLVFWLHEDSLPSKMMQNLERGLALVTTANAQAYETCESLIIMPETQLSSFPRLWRRSMPSGKGSPVWTDGFGAPVLEAERLGSGWHYRFASRFEPSWSELVLHPAFPEWVAALLSQGDVLQKHQKGRREQGRISSMQSAPQKSVDASMRANSAAQSLHMPLLILAVILYGVERWMSDRKKN